MQAAAGTAAAAAAGTAAQRLLQEHLRAVARTPQGDCSGQELAASAAALSSAMACRPRVSNGNYFRTPPRHSRKQCRAYDAPPFDGRLLCTIAPDTTLGPVENYYESWRFVSICVRGYWMNVWGMGDSGRYVNFAYRVSDTEVANWKRRGWQD